MVTTHIHIHMPTDDAGVPGMKKGVHKAPDLHTDMLAHAEKHKLSIHRQLSTKELLEDRVKLAAKYGLSPTSMKSNERYFMNAVNLPAGVARR